MSLEEHRAQLGEHLFLKSYTSAFCTLIKPRTSIEEILHGLDREPFIKSQQHFHSFPEFKDSN